MNNVLRRGLEGDRQDTSSNVDLNGLAGGYSFARLTYRAFPVNQQHEKLQFRNDGCVQRLPKDVAVDG